MHPHGARYHLRSCFRQGDPFNDTVQEGRSGGRGGIWSPLQDTASFRPSLGTVSPLMPVCAMTNLFLCAVVKLQGAITICLPSHGTGVLSEGDARGLSLHMGQPAPSSEHLSSLLAPSLPCVNPGGCVEAPWLCSASHVPCGEHGSSAPHHPNSFPEGSPFFDLCNYSCSIFLRVFF